jgi:hypothetical protein
VSQVDSRQLGAVERWTLVLAAIAVPIAWLCLSRRMTLGVSLGAGVMAANAWALRRIGQRVVEKRPRAGYALLLFNVKMALLIALVYVVVRYLPVDPIGFLIGISVFPVAVVIAAVRIGMHQQNEPDAPGGASAHGDADHG